VTSNGVDIPTREAFQVVFALAAGVALAGTVIAAFIPRRERRYEETQSIPIQHPPDP
jgi:hypothetical protein